MMSLNANYPNNSNPINQKIAIQFVQKLGFKHVHPYDNGLQALEGLRKMAKEGNPCQLILMDVQMPIMDGYEGKQCLILDLWTNH